MRSKSIVSKYVGVDNCLLLFSHHTGSRKMVGLFVLDAERPPFGLCLFWIALPRDRCSHGDYFAAVVGMFDLLLGLHDFDETLCDDLAIDLLKISQRHHIVRHHILLISESEIGNFYVER